MENDKSKHTTVRCTPGSRDTLTSMLRGGGNAGDTEADGGARRAGKKGRGAPEVRLVFSFVNILS
jgi:hypothetical protein